MPPEIPSTPDPAVRPVQAFRGSESRQSLHRREGQLVAILGLHLCFLPWALGTTQPWSQVTSLLLAALGFVAALMPRDYTRDMPGVRDPYRLLLWPRLARFPVFWIGVALLVYVLIQAVNPSWRYAQQGDYWWLEKVPNVRWLPSGIDVPFGRSNAWRQLIVYAAAWLLVCSIWTGLTRRRSVRILLGIVVINALALVALLGIQRMTGDHRIPWPLTELTPRDITASFIYENHAGAYLGLAAFTGIALATWFYDHGRRALAKSTPAGVVAFGALLLVGGVFFTLSRGAGLVMLIALALYAVWFYLRTRFRPQSPGHNPAVTKVISFFFLAFVVVAFRYIDFSDIATRWDSMLVQRSNEPDVRSRVMAREAASTMLGDHWVRGVGAGGFRQLFPQYIRHYPEVYQDGTLFWEHAHCDWLEIPIELGLAGDLLLLAGTGWWIAWFVRRGAIWHALAIPLLLGCLQTLMHAGFDFPLQCPAVLLTWCALLTAAGRWVEISKS